MLVLTRKVGEGIAIGDDVKIIVMQIKGKQVRIGIKAAPSTPVHREEIYQKIQDENRAASQAGAGALAEAGQVLGAPREVGQAPMRQHLKIPKSGAGGDDGG